VPAISQATVYKNIHLFVKSGVFREVSMHHDSLRVERNDESHHHLVCSKCKSISDIGEKSLGWCRRTTKCPADFWLKAICSGVIGIGAKCQKA
jgi:Fur family peroxide stress response transcriptional regulator